MNVDGYTKQQLQNIISGVGITEQKSTLHAARNFLCRSFATNTTITKNFEQQQKIKEEQKQQLIQFTKENDLLLQVDVIDESLYLTEGGEAKVYFSKDGTHVLKLNDAVYYNTWLDFFNSICIHNIFFPETGYELLGFCIREELQAVLKQNYIASNEDTDLLEVEILLKANGFNKIKGLDYYNAEMGIRLEDIHEENVIKQNSVYFFIDTVFYLDLK